MEKVSKKIREYQKKNLRLILPLGRNNSNGHNNSNFVFDLIFEYVEAYMSHQLLNLLLRSS